MKNNLFDMIQQKKDIPEQKRKERLNARAKKTIKQKLDELKKSFDYSNNDEPTKNDTSNLNNNSVKNAGLGWVGGKRKTRKGKGKKGKKQTKKVKKTRRNRKGKK